MWSTMEKPCQNRWKMVDNPVKIICEHMVFETFWGVFHRDSRVENLWAMVG
jgi:hypothetical protein